MGWVSPSAVAHAQALAGDAAERPGKPAAELTVEDFTRMPFRRKVALSQEHPDQYERLLSELMGQPHLTRSA